MDTDSFIVYIKTDDIHKDIPVDVKTRFNTSDYELNKPLPKRKKEKVIGLMEDQLGGKIVKYLQDQEQNHIAFLTDNNDEAKKAKSTKKCV